MTPKESQAILPHTMHKSGSSCHGRVAFSFSLPKKTLEHKTPDELLATNGVLPAPQG